MPYLVKNQNVKIHNISNEITDYKTNLQNIHSSHTRQLCQITNHAKKQTKHKRKSYFLTPRKHTKKNHYIFREPQDSLRKESQSYHSRTNFVSSSYKVRY